MANFILHADHKSLNSVKKCKRCCAFCLKNHSSPFGVGHLACPENLRCCLGLFRGNLFVNTHYFINFCLLPLLDQKWLTAALNMNLICKLLLPLGGQLCKVTQWSTTEIVLQAEISQPELLKLPFWFSTKYVCSPKQCHITHTEKCTA